MRVPWLPRPLGQTRPKDPEVGNHFLRKVVSAYDGAAQPRLIFHGFPELRQHLLMAISAKRVPKNAQGRSRAFDALERIDGVWDPGYS